MCGLCCSFVSQNMPVTPKQKGAMFWQGLTGAAASWSRVVLWLLIIAQPSLKACARVFRKQCECVLILQQSSSKQKHPSPKWTIITTSIYMHGNTFFFSGDVKYSHIPVQCELGTCWWQASSSGSSLDYTKQLAGPQWHAFNRYHGKSKEAVMWTLWSVLVICVSKCEVSICDVTNDPEIIATVTSGRKTWSVSRVEWERGEIALFHSYTLFQTGF